MNTELIELSKITANPYQPRLEEDAGHVIKVAISILQNGMWQTPIGRVHPDGSGRVQLAFGHTRLAAYRLISSVQEALKRDPSFRASYEPGSPLALLDTCALQAIAAGEVFTSMPVQVRQLSDEEMFRLGLGENIDRKDLTPLEIARAMRTYQVSFGKTSAEIGELFGGMSDSAVRNKMRLLDLPDAAKQWLQDGEITEGSARALLTLYRLPEDGRMRAEEQDEAPKPTEIIELARSGVKAEAVVALINRLAEWISPSATAEERPAYVLLNDDALGLARPATPPADITDHEEEDTEEPAGKEPEVDSFEEPEDEDEAPRPALAPVAAPSAVSQQPYGPAPSPKPAPAPQPAAAAPAPAPEPAKPLTFAESTITLTLTFWPEGDNPLGRTVVVGGRINQAAPVMRMFHEDSLDMGETLGKFYGELEDQYKDGTK